MAFETVLDQCGPNRFLEDLKPGRRFPSLEFRRGNGNEPMNEAGDETQRVSERSFQWETSFQLDWIPRELIGKKMGGNAMTPLGQGLNGGIGIMLTR